MTNRLLSLILFTPLAGALLLLLIPSSSRRTLKLAANVFGFASLGAALLLIPRFDRSAAGFQLVEKAPWIPSLGVSFHLGIDGISFLLVLLTAVIGAVSILCSWASIEHRLKEYYVLLLVLQCGMLGVFLALDFFLFFVFWEAVLVPMYFLIGLWGAERRLYAAIKFFLYTLAGSVLMLLGGLTLYYHHYLQTGAWSFDFNDLARVQLSFGVEQLVFWAFFLGFAVKTPMFPFHTWLPDAHTEAPTAGSVILAGVLLKMGTYGFLRLSLPLTPSASSDARNVAIIAILSIIAILYGALVCLMQKDWKRLVAYSSVSHMGFITLGIFSLNQAGIAGSVLQQVNHGISTGMLFLIVGMIYERRHTRAIADYGGVAQRMPGFAAVFAVAMFSSMGLPLLNGFIGEFTILQGVFQASRVWAACAAAGIILGAAYLLWLYQRTMLGEERQPGALADLTIREWAIFAPLIAWAFWIGLYPKPHFDALNATVQQLVQDVSRSEVQQAIR